MAGDSVVGSSDNGVSGLDQASKDLLNSVDPTTLAGLEGHTEVSKLGDSVLVQGQDGQGGTVGVLVPSPNLSTNGTIPSGLMEINIGAGPNIGLGIQGPDDYQQTYEANNYFGALAEGWLPEDGAGNVYRTSFNTAVERATNSAGDNAVVRLLTPTDHSEVAGEMSLAGSATVDDMAVINMYGVQAHTIVDVADFNSVAILGAGTLNVVGGSMYVAGDAANQKITGGSGNDTIVGGGGSDILTGGSGADTFGIGLDGNIMITDFGAGDKLSFGGGITLEKFVSMDVTASNIGGFAVTDLAFNNQHVYLVGVDPSALTLDMINFDL
ncbi:MAG: hypothetical protein EPN17_07240 [Methylobacter sp.]|nr:MAG: hypothetical protein EPN17_07240 [Methylobacter sp.]